MYSIIVLKNSNSSILCFDLVDSLHSIVAIPILSLVGQLLVFTVACACGRKTLTEKGGYVIAFTYLADIL
jgi:hypothetical protein